jgi:AP2 domain/HNH endonuclease
MTYKLKFTNYDGFCIVDKVIFEIFKDIPIYRHHTGYPSLKISGKYMALHRLIMLNPEFYCVDHINRKRYDNRVCNLRLCSKGQNSYNASLQKNSTSGFKGVSYHKHNKRWVAYIGKNPRTYLGSFATKEIAANAYNDAAKIRYNSFANLNNI